MRSSSRRGAVVRPRHALGHAPDAGFSLIELLVALALIGVVMTALTLFFVRTNSFTSQQSGTQVAIQLADDATERARALKGSALVDGRDRTSAEAQWASPVAGVTPYLTGSQATWDTAAVYPAGATAPLPTAGNAVTVNGIGYRQHWYIGKCWQPPAGGACGGTQTTGYVEFFRLVVAVTWPEQNCANDLCTYVTSTLISTAADEPVFNPSETAQPPRVTNPGNRTGEVSVPVNLVLAATGGGPPLTWSATGLPAGLSISSGGVVSGTPTTAGTSTVTVRVTDGFGLAGTAAFNWTVNPRPQLTDPGDQTSVVGTAVSLPITRTGGTTPFTWSVTRPGAWGATGLPPGLSINSSTGTITGTPTTAGSAKDVVVTVTDNFGQTASTTFTWTINDALRVSTPSGNRTGDWEGQNVSFTVQATGGSGAGYRWSATGLPSGTSISTAGTISGRLSQDGTYNVRVTVTDSAGATASYTFTWTVR